MKQVTLSTGQVVNLSEVWTRKAQREYNVALGAMYKESEGGDMELVKEIPVETFNIATEAGLLCLIESIENPNALASKEWLDGIPADDFSALSSAVHEIKRGTDKKKSSKTSNPS